MKNILTISFFIILVLAGCKKQVEKERPEFIGYWYSDNGADFWYDITIDKDSYAVYSSNSRIGSGGGGSSIHGIARANDKKLKIGRIFNFKIIEYPHKIDTTSSNVYIPIRTGSWSITLKKANWEMTLKGPKLHAGDGVYYKADY
jgi:hypothetical protein